MLEIPKSQSEYALVRSIGPGATCEILLLHHLRGQTGFSITYGSILTQLKTRVCFDIN